MPAAANAKYPATYPILAGKDLEQRREETQKRFPSDKLRELLVDELGFAQSVILEAPDEIPTHDASPELFSDAEVSAWQAFLLARAEIFGIGDAASFKLGRAVEGQRLIVRQQAWGPSFLVLTIKLHAPGEPGHRPLFAIGGHLYPRAAWPKSIVSPDGAARKILNQSYFTYKHHPISDCPGGVSECHKTHLPPDKIEHRIEPRDVDIDALVLAVKRDKQVELRFAYEARLSLKMLRRGTGDDDEPRKFAFTRLLVDAGTGEDLSKTTYTVLAKETKSRSGGGFEDP